MPPTTDPLTPPELSRYSRHIILPEIGRSGQERLRRSRVLVVGAGGLGSPAALYLAAAGVGTLGLADFDRVEEHNLQRQILHGTRDVGTAKTDSAARRLRDLNPHVTVRPHPEGVTADNAVALFSEYDVVVDGSDNFPTRYLNNDSAYFAGKPLVYGSIFRFEGQASCFHPREGTPCYRCLFPDPPPPGAVPNCGEAGVIGALPGVIGSIQAMEAIKHLLNIGETLCGRLLTVDLLTAGFRTINLKKDPDCPLCGERARIRDIVAANYTTNCSAPSPGEPDMTDSELPPLEVSVDEAKSLLDNAPGRALLLDVREPHEIEICRVAGSTCVPMNEIPQRIDSLPRDRHILVQCHHGGRSLRVTRYLRDRGFKAVSNIRGGIDAWAKTHDPEMARY